MVVSPQFFAWIFGFAGKAQILGPESVVDAMKEQLQRVSERICP